MADGPTGPSAFIREQCPVANAYHDGLLSKEDWAIIHGLTPGGGGAPTFMVVNQAGAPIVLAAGGVTVPANNGPAGLDITTAMSGNVAGDWVALEAQFQAEGGAGPNTNGGLYYFWNGQPSYSTGALTVYTFTTSPVLFRDFGPGSFVLIGSANALTGGTPNELRIKAGDGDPAGGAGNAGAALTLIGGTAGFLGDGGAVAILTGPGDIANGGGNGGAFSVTTGSGLIAGAISLTTGPGSLGSAGPMSFATGAGDVPLGNTPGGNAGAIAVTTGSGALGGSVNEVGGVGGVFSVVLGNTAAGGGDGPGFVFTAGNAGAARGVNPAGAGGGFSFTCGNAAFNGPDGGSFNVFLGLKSAAGADGKFKVFRSGSGTPVVTINSVGLITESQAAVGTAQLPGLILDNPTAAAAGAQQFSPGLVLSGHGWETTGPSSQAMFWELQTHPVQGATGSAQLDFSRSINGAAATRAVTFQSDDSSSATISTPFTNLALTTNDTSGGVSSAYVAMNYTGITFFLQNQQSWYQFLLAAFKPTNAGTTLGTGLLPWLNTFSNMFAGVSNGGVPTCATGTGAGGAGAAASCLAGSTDAAGTVRVTAGAAPASGGATVVTVTFKAANGAYGTAPYVVITPANAAASLLVPGEVYVDQASATTAVFVLKNASAVPLVNGTDYDFNYHVIQ